MRSVGRLIEVLLEENVGGDIYWAPECHQFKIQSEKRDFKLMTLGSPVYISAGRACLFEVLCDGVSTRFRLRTLAKSIEQTHPT